MSRDGTPPLLRCAGCGKPFPWSFTQACDACRGMVEVEYDLARVELRSEGPPMQRFFDLLPLASREHAIDGGEGNTPCLRARELGRALGLADVWLKVEGANPTFTTKDRQGSVAVAALRELGVREIATASTGNSCTALARIAARVPELRLHIFVGDEFLDRVACADAPNVSVYWLRDGSFVEAGAAAAWFAESRGIALDRGLLCFPKREALKTVFFEAAAQVERPIEWYFQGVSSGMGVYATQRAAQQLLALGRIERLPRLVCVQEETCDPLVRAWRRGAQRVHEGDLIARPRGLSKATLRGDPSGAYPYLAAAVRASGGAMTSAAQDEMRELRALLRETEGIDACFTSAMTLVAARDLARRGLVRRDATLLLNLTGAERPASPETRADFAVERNAEGWRITSLPGESDDLLAQIVELVRRSQRLGDAEPLGADTALLERDLALDSVALLELLLAIEKRFACRIEDHEVTPVHFATIGTVAAFVRRKRSGA